MNPRETDTIAAIATPQGVGGIGIIKMSGPDSFCIARKHFIQKFGHSDIRSHACPPEPFESHRLNLGFFICPSTGERLDEVFMVFMKAPRTYTGEAVVEIHAHAGPYVLQKILENLVHSGARLADPGEFTRRAFLNGKIDLTQAEAVIEVIHARNQQALSYALHQLVGSAGQVLREIRDQMIDLLSEIQARIEFEEEIPTDLSPVMIEPRLKQMYRTIKQISDRYTYKRLFCGESRIVIAGAPNVGKSTLLNRLLNRERAIVSDLPGTTRDVITESIRLKGLPFVLCDTAGIHPTDNAIEQMGIRKTIAEMESADLIVYLVDARKGLDEAEKTLIQNHAKTCMVVYNKTDLIDAPFSNEPTPQNTVTISALQGQGIEYLKEHIYTHFHMADADQTGSMTPTLRQKHGLDQAGRLLISGLSSLRSRKDASDLLAIDLKRALECIQDLLGENRNPDSMDAVFNRFCVGK